MAKSKRKRDTLGNMLRGGESQRENGTYMYRWTDGVGKRHSVYGKTLEELREKEKTVSLQNLMGIEPSVVTLNQQVEKYLSISSSCVKRITTESYRSCFNLYVRDSELGRMKISKIKKTDLQILYKNLLTERHLSVGTLSNVNSVLWNTFRTAIDDDIILKNPAENIMKEFRKRDATQKYALTVEQEIEFLERVNNNYCWRYYKPLFVVLLKTAMRISEALGLTWDDIDMDNAQISVNHQLVQIYTNGKKMMYLESPKTKSGNRMIPMSEEVKEALLIQKKIADINPDFSVDGRSNFVFTKRLRGGCVNYHTIYRLMTHAEKLNSVRDIQLPHMTPNILRHTACSRFAEAGCDLKVLQYIMGHGDISVTMNVYNHVDISRLNKEFQRVSNIVNQEYIEVAGVKPRNLTPTYTKYPSDLHPFTPNLHQSAKKTGEDM